MSLWGPIFYKNGTLVSIFHWSLKVIFWNWHLSDPSLGQRTLFLVVELARSNRGTMSNSHVVWKNYILHTYNTQLYTKLHTYKSDGMKGASFLTKIFNTFLYWEVITSRNEWMSEQMKKINDKLCFSWTGFVCSKEIWHNLVFPGINPTKCILKGCGVCVCVYVFVSL